MDHINHKTTYTDPRLAFAEEETKTLGDLRQRFDSSSTGVQVLHGRDLSGKVAVVTGANCGIGKLVGVVWCGVVWCGLVWFGLVWFGLVRLGDLASWGRVRCGVV